MKLYINDSTNSAKPLYYQSLVLLFLPCEKFGENDTENSLFIKAYQKDGNNFVNVRLEVGDLVSEKDAIQPIDDSVYAQMKNLIGRTFLACAFDIFGISPPWGISTGVKPVKLARMFVKDCGREEAYRILCDEYLISPQKAKLSVDACIFEDSVIDKMGNNPCSLYISIPFCPTKCNYCSFVSCTTPRLLSLIPQYVEKLNDELISIAETINELGLNLKSIYVGGGTPSILSAPQIDYIFKTVYNSFNLDSCNEITFEAGRPDCITYDKLKVLSDYNVDRISINTQTTNDEILKNVGRSHTYGDYVTSVELARKVGFKTINTDLIAGLPGEDLKSFENSIKDVSALKPENITVHAFTLKRSSNYRITGTKSYSIDFQEAYAMTNYAAEYLDLSGYSPYYVYRQKNTTGNLENVGYSKLGHESIYNVIMMGEYHTVFGAGAGSVTKLVTNSGCRVERIFSPKYPYEFLDNSKYKGFDKASVTDILKDR